MRLIFGIKMVMPARFEPATCSLGESRSIQLSYGTPVKNTKLTPAGVENI